MVREIQAMPAAARRSGGRAAAMSQKLGKVEQIIESRDSKAFFVFF